MLEYYEPLKDAAKRLGLDEGWMRVLCEKGRISPHIVKFEGRWFLPKDAAPTREGGHEKRDRIEGYESMKEAEGRIGHREPWIIDRARNGFIKDSEGRTPKKVGGVWFVPVGANLEVPEREYAWPKDKRQRYAQWQRDRRARLKAKG